MFSIRLISTITKIIKWGLLPSLLLACSSMSVSPTPHPIPVASINIPKAPLSLEGIPHVLFFWAGL